MTRTTQCCSLGVSPMVEISEGVLAPCTQKKVRFIVPPNRLLFRGLRSCNTFKLQHCAALSQQLFSVIQSRITLAKSIHNNIVFGCGLYTPPAVDAKVYRFTDSANSSEEGCGHQLRRFLVSGGCPLPRRASVTKLLRV